MNRVIVLLGLVLSAMPVSAAEPLKVLFLGDRGHHLPMARFTQLEPAFAARGIALTYTDEVADLNPTTLSKYAGVMIFANHTEWAPENEKALLDYVESGHGFIPVHCASFCFTKSAKYIDLVGAQFRSHTTGVFRTKTTDTAHPIMAGCDSFSSWDETYVHTKHNTKNRTVLEVRTEGDLSEPWTWVRTQGTGRVFYTAWGHDQRTWSHEGFQTLLERGTKWACGQSLDTATTYIDRPKMTPFAADAKPIETIPAKVPFYPPGEKWGTLREPLKTMPVPLSSDESLKHYSTPVGFEMKTFITEEKLGGGKPLAMTWDERGRLWLSLTFDYPNELKTDRPGRDKIIVCEDTDGDGTADTISTFAEGLSIPTSILNVRGGLLVHQVPHTLFLKDTDGDGRADARQIVLEGWGTNDTHAGPSNLRYGPDNWIYGMVGYSGFNGTVAGEKHKFGNGLYRFKLKPDCTAERLEFLRSTNNNSWGVGFNERGELFGSTANGCPLVHLTIPNRYFEKVRGLTPSALANIAMDNHYEPATDKIRQVDWHGGFTSAAACTIYTARTYPPEYWNRAAFICEPTGHLAATMILQPNGTSYIARYGWNLVASNDEWAAPIDAQVGPDGQMWMIDWYNYIVQHNPTPQGFKTGKGNAYETELRDKKYGRIYRIVYTAAKPEARMNLSGATREQLLETLKHHNMGWRLHAQRLLVEAGEPVERFQVVADAKAFNKKLLTSDSLSERLAGFLALADAESTTDIGMSLADALADPVNYRDNDLKTGLTIASAVHAPAVLAAVATRPALPAQGLPVLELIAKSYASSPARSGISTVVASLKDLKAAANGDAILAGLAAGWPAKTAATLDASAQAGVGELLKKVSPTSRGRLLKLANTWGIAGLDTQLGELAQSLMVIVQANKATDATDTERLAAVSQILELQPDNDATIDQLLAVAKASKSPDFSGKMIELLAVSKSKSLGGKLVGMLPTLSPTAKPTALRVILSRADSASAFLDAVEAGTVRFDILALDQKTTLATHPDAKVSARAKALLAAGGGLPDANRQKVIAELHPLLAKTGNPGLGKKAFTTHCAKCHKHGGEGNIIGPDLTGFAVHPKEEILIHVMDPSRSVEGNYKSYTASLADGRVIQGLLSSETKTTVELLDAENKRHAIARDDLESLSASAKSLMPEGFEKSMKPEELVDLLEFMTQKGKYVPIPLDKYATIVSTKGMFNDTESSPERLIFKDWTPKEFQKVPFYLVDPQGERVKNVVLLNSTSGKLPPTMPKSVMLPCNTPVKALHILGGVAGWAFPYGERGSVSMIVKLHYDDGTTELHELKNGVHIADYIRRVDVPQSEFAFSLRGQQVRYLSITPKKATSIKSIELIKGADSTAPVVMAVTIETP